MSKWKSRGYNRRAYVSAKIRAWAKHKESAALIPENKAVFCPRVSADVVISIKLKGHPSMSFRSYRTPWNSWTISPTLAGQKIQQAMIGYGATL